MPRGLDRRALLMLLGAAALLRLFIAYVWLPGGGFPTDLGTFTAWGLQLAERGPATFYATSGFADYPPGYLYVLWVLGIVAHVSNDTIATMGSLIKLPAMAADIAIGALLAVTVARARVGKPDAGRLALLAAGLYLFNPLTIHDSALWGQVDAVGLLVMLGCIWALMRGATELALPAAMLAAMIKPQFGLVLAPIIIVLVLRRHIFRPGSGPQPDGRLAALARLPSLARLAIGMLGAVATFFILATPFGLSPLDMVNLLGKTASTYPYLTVNAFNPWALIGTAGMPSFADGGGWQQDSATLLFGLSAFSIGTILLVAGLVLSAAIVAYRDDRRSLLIALTLAALAFFVLPTRVHERYLFPVTALLPLLAITSRRYLALGIAVTAAAFANFHGVLLSYAKGATAQLPGKEIANDSFTITVAALVSLAALIFIAFDSDLVRRLLASGMRAVGWPLSEQPDPLTGPGILPAPAAPVPAPRSRRAAKAAGAASTTAPSTTARGSKVAPAPVPARSATRRRLPRFLATFAAYAKDPKVKPKTGRDGLNRRDAALAAGLIALAFVTRFIGLGTPAGMHFDEVYHARTATEFLQDWRYGMPHSIYEFTHPHLAKYAMAGGITLFGHNEVVATGTLPASHDSVLEPRYTDQADPAAQRGERLYLATGSAIEVYSLPERTQLVSLPFPAVLLALDTSGHRLFASDAAGGLVLFADTAAIGPAGVSPVALGSLPAPADKLVASDDGGVFALLGGTRVVRLDATGGTPTADRTFEAPIDSLLSVRSGRLALADDELNLRVVSADLTDVSAIELTARASDLALVSIDGSKIYATTTAGLEVATLDGASGALVGAPIVPMPGEVRALLVNPSSGLAHVLGHTPDNENDTVYVVEPRGNAVFADAVLPFAADRIFIDATPAYPGSDPQIVLATSDAGEVAVVNAGSNATAWRLPGVIAGAFLIGFLFLLGRLLLARRPAALFAVTFALLDGMFFATARIAMNDIYVTTFIVAAYTLFAALWLGRWRGKSAALLGLPMVGLLLGLALSSKWVALYAMGGIALLILARTRIGRRLIVAGLVAISGTLGLTSLSEGNLVFSILMLGLTALTTVLVVRRGPDVEPETSLPLWLRPGPGWLWAGACLLVLPVGVYILHYAPWVALGNQWMTGLPAGNTGQTLSELTSSIYNYHDQLRATHAAGSPWWAWPLDLKPVWFASSSAANGLSAQLHNTGNLVVFWLAIPALIWAAVAARRRRDLGLTFLVVAFAAAWLSWARIDRVTFEYHYFSALPFAVLALGALVGELWGRRPSAGTFLVAKAGVALAICTPAALWVARGPLCAISGASGVEAANSVCGADANVSSGLFLLTVTALALLAIAARAPLDWRGQLGFLGTGSVLLAAAALSVPREIGFIQAVAALIMSGLIASFVLGLRDPRKLALGIVGAALVVAALFYPIVANVLVPSTYIDLWHHVLPTWDYYFQFATNTNASPAGPGLTVMAAITGLIALNVYGLVRSLRRGEEVPPQEDLPELTADELAARLAGKGSAKKPVA